ncbi:hypothetical protein KY290_019261 [Solanum tuberosum]|uniref:Uncharacterized protein n=1 Tax=Solanum tuberosum TaxID=4113 RepID=A0ABQ7VGJ2_SOLTU|nr:hypothetical protein KY290_019261 [Solanum tuberosum]
MQNLGLSNQNVRIATVANQIRRRVAFALVSFRLRPPWTGRDHGIKQINDEKIRDILCYDFYII